MLTYPKNYEGSITVIGEKGTAKVGGVAVNEIQTWDFAEASDADKNLQQASYETQCIYGFGHRAYYRNVLESLLYNKPADTDGHEGLRSLETLEAIYLSRQLGRPITLPLEKGRESIEGFSTKDLSSTPV